MIKRTLRSRNALAAVIGLSVGSLLVLGLTRQQARPIQPWQRVCHSPPFSQLEDGMTSIAVRKLLGEPTTVNPVRHPQTVEPMRPRIVEMWQYAYPGIRGWTVIYFGEDDRVVTHSCGPV